ncbi:HNH endonuclease [Streptomyces nigrescens]
MNIAAPLGPIDPRLIDEIEGALANERTRSHRAVIQQIAESHNVKRKFINGSRTVRKKATIAKRDGARCAYCQEPFPDLSVATLDHVIPYCLVRTNANWNLVLSCSPCNNGKGCAIPDVMLPMLASLIVTLGQLGKQQTGGAR